MTTIALAGRERATVLAALRFWRRCGTPDEPEYDIAWDSVEPRRGERALGDDEIDALCERINVGPPDTPPLVVEFHYDDGDVGAHHVEDDEPARLVWAEFSASDPNRHKPSHVVIRRAGDDEVEADDGGADALPARRVKMVCRTCGSDDVQADAYASWSIERQEWFVDQTFEKGAYCADCDGESKIDVVEITGDEEDEDDA